NENNAEDYFNNLKFDLQYTEELNTQITTLDPKNSVEELKNIFYDLNENRRKKFHYLIEALENVTIILAYQNEIPEKKRMAAWCKIKCDLQCDLMKENPNIDSNFEAFITKIQSIDEFISYLKECIHSWNKFTNEKKTQYFPKVYETFQSDQISKEDKLNKLNNKTECNPKQSMKTECTAKEYKKTECTPKECMKTECNSNKNDKKVNSTQKNNKNKTKQKRCNKK
ncbi:exported protein (PHISTc), partial [Plasmodium gaboni]